MRNLADSELQDPKLSDWDAGWRNADTTPSAIHALLLLADNNEKGLQQVAKDVLSQSADFGIQVRVQEQGKRLKEGPEGKEHDIEHFGYADGVSQPLYLSDDVSPEGPSPTAGIWS
ncbi:hypothetical protein [Hymenobacter cellulosilyticus]|uniref:Uncharacterized protein n=1 Tax=Hymenobacter cellulosilyticus TaxID=2932248 RepID=A0A8T9QDA5_9BACT|nr:hypothetical protein [Hymenobacter cellulosilyticus]UOQ73549.1 hypothetical protein MUN79_06355 [Hymenobacter cellulosilyticus]